MDMHSMGLQLSWLERTPDKGEVDGPIPFRPTMHFQVIKERKRTPKHLAVQDLTSKEKKAQTLTLDQLKTVKAL